MVTVSTHVKRILEYSQLALANIKVIITDGGEAGSAKLLATPSTLWIWCTVHKLSLIFEDSFRGFPLSTTEEIPLFLVQLRKICKFLIVNHDKMKVYLPLPEGHVKVNCKLVISV